MKTCFRLIGVAALFSLTSTTVLAQPAIVGPVGYATSFAVRPPAAEWSSFSFAGQAGNPYNITNDVQTLAATGITAPLADGAAADPPNGNALAVWTSGGGSYLMTRPTGNRFTVFMVTLLNTSGTNATSARLACDFSIKVPVAEPDYPGHRAYYSLTGLANSWVAIPEFSSATPAAGTLTANLAFVTPWNHSNTLYVLWADDNASFFGTDPGYALDNVSAAITAGMSLRPPVTANLTAPTNNAPFFGAAAITLAADAAAPEHTVTNVAFFADDVKIGDDATGPYSFEWNNVPLGPHRLRAVASDELGVTGQSALVNVLVYDAVGAPFVRVTSPTNGFVAEGPTNLAIAAVAFAVEAVTNVQFLNNGTPIGDDATSPFSVSWAAPFGTNALTAVAARANGQLGTSEVVTVRITIPPTNTVAPSVAGQTPLAFATIGGLTNISVTFSERVQNVDASDLLLNGVPATQLAAMAGGSNYVFAFPQPDAGEIEVSWALNHGITDFEYPANLPFNRTGPGATWSYNLVDQTPPVVAARLPAAGATVTNLTQATVTFSETVLGVDASDFLVNGAAALGVNGGGATYAFSFTQPPAGAVNITWAGAHGISDASANAFNAASATWSYTLDLRVPLVQSNATWRFVKGTAEASTPIEAWRQLSFDDSGWSNAPAPFFFGDPYSNGVPAFTLLSDMQGNYSTIYLRKKFNLIGASATTNLFFNFQIDDGFVAWINGVEVLRFNAPVGDVPYNGLATGTAQEQGGPGGQGGAAYLLTNLLNSSTYLVDGENVLTVHAFNQSLAQSTDFGFNAQLSAIQVDLSAVAPSIAAVTPQPGSLFFLTNLAVRFTEGVSGVDAADLLVSGVPATNVSSTTNTIYTFSFAQPAFGPVAVTWAGGHGMADFDNPPKPFAATAPGAIFSYSLVNPSAPTVAAQSPPAGAFVNHLTQFTVSFSEAVTGVDAADLRVNGGPATGVSGGPVSYVFTFPQPDYGAVSIGWAANPGITDTEPAQNPFDGTRAGNLWTYTLVDQTPPTLIGISPAPGLQVTNLTQVTVTFSEPVTGVNASDLRVNGVAATGLSGAGVTYTFSFPQPNATILQFTWVNAHGIRDFAPVANSFDATAPGATWSYSSPDTLAPATAEVTPAPFVTVRSLTQIRVTFTEPVTGVDTNDLLINGTRALSVSGSGAGPYTFSFLPPGNGIVTVLWVASTGIRDLATPTANPFAGSEWSYILDPSATFAGKVVISEIMFNPAGGRPADEWVELRNVTTNVINLAGWRFSRGVNFTFPNISIPTGGHVVAAANLARFQTAYPDVTNVVAGWTGSLANSDETIELETALGEVVNSVHYGTEGDWARRERGHGAARVESLSRNGGTATVSLFDHGYTANDQILISGADQPEYNGLFVIGGVTSSSFTYAVAGTPGSPATGPIIARHTVDDGASGWSWFAPADGFGQSIELVNAALGNVSGQNWLPSASGGGTPGAPNSAASANVAPPILEPTHFPPVPRSTEPVAVTARVFDELTNGIASVRLFYRNHTTPSPGAFSSTNMLDDGAHSDGLNRDGLYGAVLPAMPNGTVIEFYVQATDSTGLSRTWPAPTWETNNTLAQLANALYQVDDEAIADTMPALRVVLSGSEYAVFPWTNRESDAEVNATFISADGDGTKVRHLSGVRIRGAGSRSQQVPNNRVNIPNDNRWNGLQAINLNSLYVHSQIMGAAVSQRAGLPASPGRLIQYRRNGVNPSRIEAPGGGGFGGGRGDGYGTFIMVQPVSGDLAGSLFPNDGDGNVYRASMFPHDADLSYQGTNPSSYRVRGYFKTSNQTENDWSDMFNLTFAFSRSTAPLADYLAAISTNVNVELWMRYFAVGTLISHTETSMFNGRGDDYALYRGVNDPRFVAIGHDFDTIFGQGDTTTAYSSQTNSSLFIMLSPPNTGGNAPNMPLLRRFLTNGVVAPLFFAEIKRLCDTVFHPSQMGPLMDQMLTWPNGPTTLTIEAMKNHAFNRRAVVLSQIPLALTVHHSLSSASGFPMTTTPNVTLFGAFHAIDTRKVLVNGALAGLSPWEGRWTNSVTLQPGINSVLVQTLDSNNVEFARGTVDLWYDGGSVTSVSGAVVTDTVWSAANGPYQVTANLTVNSGATLTIQAGATVYLSPGVNLTVANGGRILAEGTDAARLRFSPAPGAANWGGMVINGGTGSPESRIAYAHFAGYDNTAIDVNAGDLLLSRCSFGNSAERHLDLDGASFVVEDCYFPASTAAFEPIHGTIGIKAGGRGIIRRNFMGRTLGYNDSIDFTGGNRPGPILQILNNVFMGSDDDLLDLDSTDAWVEGNVFLHTHRNGSPDSASAVSGGADNADTSQITIVGNLFYDVDHAANAKQGNFYTMLNNTIVHQTRIGSEDTNTAVVILADMNEQGTFTAQGAGMYLEGNIILDAENLTRHVTTALVTYTNNLIHQLAGAPWTGPGGGNVNADPLLTRIPPFSETTNYNSWAAAQVMWEYFRPRTGSPASGSGPNGRDHGAVASSPSPLGGERAGVRGVSLSGEPLDTTPLTIATLRVDPLRTGNGIPTAGFADGSGFTRYRWRLDGGAWSAESPTANPITLSALSAGPHYVEVVGRNDAGFSQDDPSFGEDAVVTLSRTWTVDPTASALRLNEILASNGGAVNHVGTKPDVIELHNASDAMLNLAGMRLSDDLDNPDKFIFPAGASVSARGYLVVYANNPDGTPGSHVGFSLGLEGESLFLFAAAANGGRLLDSITFGPQLTDLSIGRLADGEWALTQPTFGAANREAQLGDPRGLRLNEWLAIGETPFNSDFIELYNTDPLPVALAGLYLTDAILGWPDRHQMAVLSFIAGNGYLRLLADGNTGAGADHLNFALNGDQSAIALNAADLSLIDSVVYPGQRPNVSQGRSPNGASTLAFFDTPTPGAPNPTVTGPPPFGGALVINEVLANNASLGEFVGTNRVTPDWVELYNGTTSAIDLGNLSLSDDTLLPRKFVFADGTVIAAGGHLRMLCADSQPASASNTGFGLTSAGGAIYLFDRPANGGSLINSIVYGIQTPDLSVGRVPSGGANWALNTPTPNAANAAVPTLGDVANLKVNEWLANPVEGEDDWFEIYNPNPLPVALGGLHLTDDLNNRTKHRIAALSFLGTATNAYLRIHADGNTGAGADHVAFSLNAEGEDAGLSTTNGTLIHGQTFVSQQEGISEGRFPDGDTNIVAFPGTASPGESNWRQLAGIVINEVLTHTDLPLEDAIELRNLTGQPIDVGGWWLSDDEGTLQKYQIPAPSLIPPNGFTVIYENVFTNAEFAAIPFALSSQGDEVVLSAYSNNALTGYRTRVDFGAAANGVSFGRYVTSDSRVQHVPMSARTFGADDPGSVEEFRTGRGAANAYPRVGPVVITEVMYHPPDLGTNDNGRDEFIELRNITTAPVPLFDSTNGWRLRDAVDFDFPTGTIISPGDHLLIVGFDPVNNPVALAAFRAVYNLAPGSANILGPWSGKLANDTESIELRRPDAPHPDGTPYILVERVRYADLAPWPPQADGTGFSLQRLTEDDFGNDPVNWVAAAPTPGPAGSAIDSDSDGLPDAWEIANGFDPFNPNDAALDTDGDGLSNLQEFQLGTDPRNPASGLRLQIALAPGGTNVVLSFAAAANLAYSIEHAVALGATWQSLQNFPAAPTNRVVSHTVVANGMTRFYRLRIESGPPQGALRFNSIQQLSGDRVALNFTVPASQSCAVLFTPSLGAVPWSTLTNYPAAPALRVLESVNPAPGARGFFRLRSP